MKKNNLCVFCIVLIVLTVGWSAPADAQDASFELIPGSGSTSVSFWARGVSADGSVVGGVEDGTVFRWTEAAGTEFLSGADWNNTFTAAVSGDGSTILSTVDDGTGVFAPSLYTDAGGWVSIGGLIPSPPSGRVSLGTGYALNDDGTVAAGLAWKADQTAEAFSWDAVGGMVGLGQPGDILSSRANGVSGDGSVVVGFFENVDTGCRRPARWTDEGAVDLFLGAEICGEAYSVSTDGRIIVGSAYVPGADYETAFYFTDAGGWVDLGKLVDNPFHSAMATSIADNGTLVGLSGDAASQNWKGFVWTQADGMQEIEEYLTSLGVTVPDGLYLAEARDISADGSTIVGTVVDTNGYLNAYMATIPTSLFVDGFESGGRWWWSAVVSGQ
jgi:uncharacterized membrane protein